MIIKENYSGNFACLTTAIGIGKMMIFANPSWKQDFVTQNRRSFGRRTQNLFDLRKLLSRDAGVRDQNKVALLTDRQANCVNL